MPANSGYSVQAMRRGSRVLLACLAFCVFLSIPGCGNQALRWEHEAYVVRPGDTLYAIAWHFGIDARELASWNQLGSGEVIYPGQRLRLKPPSASVASRATERPKSRGAPPVKPSAAPREPQARRPSPAWQWPTEGPVIAAFGDRASVGKGIDIGGKTGQGVLSAADGRVVYAGSGLVGYGQLIIIKHNETYLSAYAHNAALLVQQGDAIERGQKIATMGLGPGRRPMLHFEIRVNGEAVDPVRFLPPR